MSSPKRIYEITIEDLSRQRWCYFHDDDEGFDGFEWVIPDTHPKFSQSIIELELAKFRFHGGEEFAGMFDGSASFSVCLAGKWHTFWSGCVPPNGQMKADFARALHELGLSLPVVATARWTGRTECYYGLRYLDEFGNEVET